MTPASAESEYRKEHVAFFRLPIPADSFGRLVDWLEEAYGDGLGVSGADTGGFIHVYRNQKISVEESKEQDVE